MKRPARLLPLSFVLLALSLCSCRRAVAERLDGVSVAPLEGARFVVLVFLATDCPISNHYAPELQRLRLLYAPRGVVFHWVFADTHTSANEARTHLRSYGFQEEALRDVQHALVQRAQATTTPEVAVFANGSLQYHGRIDNRFVAFGRMRPAPTERDLVAVLDALLAGRTPPVRYQVPLGCAIPQ